MALASEHGRMDMSSRLQVQVYQLKTAMGLIRALRMELHTGQHLSGLLLRELYRAELDQGRCETDAQPHATRAQRIASLQDTLLRQQKRCAVRLCSASAGLVSAKY